MTYLLNVDHSILRFNFEMESLERWFVRNRIDRQLRFMMKVLVAEEFDKTLAGYFIEVEHMAKKPSSAKMFTTRFATISLDKEGKKVAKQWIKDHINDVETYWVNLGVDGWKESSSYDVENDCWICSLTQKIEGHRNHDICVTSRATNPVEGLMLNVYKLVVLYPDAVLPTEREEENWG